MTVAAPGRLAEPVADRRVAPVAPARRLALPQLLGRHVPRPALLRPLHGRRRRRHLLPTCGPRGVFTIQGFPPKTPFLAAEERRFTPYGVGYVDLGGEVLVESRLAARSVEELRTGMDMELAIDPFFTGADGEPVLTFAFKPVA